MTTRLVEASATYAARSHSHTIEALLEGDTSTGVRLNLRAYGNEDHAVAVEKKTKLQLLALFSGLTLQEAYALRECLDAINAQPFLWLVQAASAEPDPVMPEITPLPAVDPPGAK